MLYNHLKIFFLLAITALLLSSCSEDDSGDIINGATGNTNNFQSNRGNGNGNGDGQNGGDVADLSSGVALQWMELFLELERYADGMRPNASARALAYIGLAAYETAVDEMDGYRSNEGRIPGFDLRGSQNVSDAAMELALNACYADVMDHFLLNVPSDLKGEIDVLERTLEGSLSDGLSNRAIDDAKNFGASIASQVIEFSQTDTEAEKQVLEPQPTSYEPPVGEGFWTYSAEPERALFPYWGSVRTFIIAPDQTTTVPPLAYSENPSNPYYQEMVEVYNANNDARNKDDEQLWIAEFWSDDVGGLTFGPPSRQIAIANQLIEKYGLDLGEALYLYLKLGFSLNDAAVSTWKYKYQYMVMRPSVFIHEFIDPDYQTNLFRLIPWPNPSFPGYPSGHSCFASAAAGVFIDFFGNETNFTDRSHEGRTEFRSTPRTYTTFEQMAAENAYSRIPLGVHIRMDCTEGLRLGYEISDAINDYRLKRRRA